MDTLALLCNLHADGPATLHRLRRAGCESVAALRRLDPVALAARLEWNERTAERFLREAALLAERVEDEPPVAPELEPELEPDGETEELELESTLVEELDGETDEAEDEEVEEDEDEPEEEVEAGYAPPPERVEAVLGAWRELDRVAPPGDPADFVLPRPQVENRTDLDLGAVQLDGLTDEVVARLAALGVRTLRELTGARELELARSIGLGYTRLKRLQFLAARELERLPVPSRPPARPAAAFEPFTPPPTEPFETAGPFA